MKITALLAALSLSVCLAAGTADAATLRWAAQNDILTLDPHSQNHATTNAILMHAYEGLTRYDKDYKVEPALATEVEQGSARRRWRFNLRKDVKFHDGSPFTADDVIFSFDRIKQPQGTMQIYVTGISEIRKIDDHTIDVMLATPIPILLRNIIDFRIMSKAWAEKNKTEKTQDLQGQGRELRVAQRERHRPLHDHGWPPDQRIAMERQQGLVGQARGQRDRGDLHPDQADATRVAALLSGDVDMLTDLPTQDVARLRRTTPSSRFVDGPEVRTIFIGARPGQRRAEVLRRQGQEPVQGQARAQGAEPGHRRAKPSSARRCAACRFPAGIMVAPGVNGNTQELDTRAQRPIRQGQGSCWPRPATRTGSSSRSTARTTAT